MTEAIASITAVASSVITFVEGNAIMMIFMTAPVVGVAVGFIKKLIGRY